RHRAGLRPPIRARLCAGGSDAAARSPNVTLVSAPVRPGEFCQSLLSAMLAAEGLVKRRGRNQTPDTIGLALKRDLLERAVEDDPPPDAFESWLVAQVLASPAGGPVRAMCAQILDEYRLAALDPAFAGWLAE